MDNVLKVVNRSNQRGGRMLSVVDLLEAGTLSMSHAAWLLRKIEEGSSWLVGARPGGAGKTTVMSALIAMLPEKTPIKLTNPGSGWKRCSPGDCIVSYEISPGSYDAYLWGEDLRALTELGLAGCRIVSNLHADTLDEAREQIVRENNASEEGFMAFDVFIPLTLKTTNEIRTEGSGNSASPRSFSRFSRTPVVEKIFTASNGEWREVETTNTASGGVRRENEIEQFLEDCLRRDYKMVEDVRSAWLERK